MYQEEEEEEKAERENERERDKLSRKCNSFISFSLRFFVSNRYFFLYLIILIFLSLSRSLVVHIPDFLTTSRRTIHIRQRHFDVCVCR